MDPSHFDATTRRFAALGSRRRVLAALVVGALGVGGRDAAAAAVCRAPGNLCRTNANCCPGLLCARDGTGRRRCACPPPTVACDSTCVDLGADAGNCGFCGNVCPAGATCTAGQCQCSTDYVLCTGTAGNHCCPSEGTCNADGTCACLPRGTSCSAFFRTCDFCCNRGFGCNVIANTCNCA
ncbi:MAG TPA: hypothetical protein VH482_08685 [Thermomicrobiales bacterium]